MIKVSRRGLLVVVIPTFVAMLTLIAFAVGFYNANLSDKRLYGVWSDAVTGYSVEIREDGAWVDSISEVQQCWRREGRVLYITDVYGNITTAESSVAKNRLTLTFGKDTYNMEPVKDNRLHFTPYNLNRTPDENLKLLEAHKGTEEILFSLISEDSVERITLYKDGVFESSFLCGDSNYKTTETGIYAMSTEKIRLFRRDSVLDDLTLIHGSFRYGSGKMEGTCDVSPIGIVGSAIDRSAGKKYIFSEDLSVFVQDSSGKATIYEYAVTGDKIVIIDKSKGRVVDSLLLLEGESNEASVYSYVYEYTESAE